MDVEHAIEGMAKCSAAIEQLESSGVEDCAVSAEACAKVCKQARATLDQFRNDFTARVNMFVSELSVFSKAVIPDFEALCASLDASGDIPHHVLLY